MRRRLARVFYAADVMGLSLNDLRLNIEYYGYRHGDYTSKFEKNSSHWDEVCEKAPIEMLLDMISIYLEHVKRKNEGRRYDRKISLKNLLKRINEIFEEEKVLFYVDDDGVVHPKIDTAFSSQYGQLIRGLDSSTHSQVLTFLEDAEGFYMKEDFASSIEKVHKAAENIFKQTYQKQQLGSKTLKDVEGDFLTGLKSMLPETNSSQQVAKNTFAMIQDWISSIHPYRHADENEAREQPDEDLAIWLYATGLSVVRVLLAIQKRSQI